MPKNIVICCDGTGNEIKEELSNVLKLYQLSTRGVDQACFYDPGVGTIGRLNNWTKFRDKIHEVLTGATGYGLDENVIDAYSFLAGTYEDGDNIFLFGFKPFE